MFKDNHNFNPRSPWGERHIFVIQIFSGLEFQSTLPVGGATNILSTHKSMLSISIHAPRGGSDAMTMRPWSNAYDFNPRSPWGERRFGGKGTHRLFRISIHAPRGGSDEDTLLEMLTFVHFNPRSPWGERRFLRLGQKGLQLFQSTLPVGGATYNLYPSSSVCKISIHAPRGGSDLQKGASAKGYGYFNPRSPWGERRFGSSFAVPLGIFQSTLPVGGATAALPESGLDQLLFQSTLPVGGATRKRLTDTSKWKPFQSTLPVGGAT